MYTSDEMFDLSGIIYDRLKDIIKEELEKSQPQKGSNDNNLSENGESGDTVSDPEDTYEMEESRSTEGTDDTSEKSPESNSQESDSNETPQEKELVNESKDSVKSDSSDEKRQEEDSDNGTEKSADESEESNCEEGGEGTGDASGQLPPVESSGEKYSGRPLPDKTNEGTPPGEVSCDDDERDGKGHGTEETGDDQEKHMHAEGDDSSTVNGNDGDSTRDAAPKSPDQSGDQEEGEKVNEGHDDHLKNRPPRNNYPGDTGDGHSDASDTISGDDRPTSGKDGEDHASDEIINKRVQKLIDDLNASDESFDIMTVVNKAINNTSINDLPYMVDPSVKDVIIYGREVTDMEGTMIRDIGLKMLGSKGAQLTKLFISQTKPRIMYNRTTGSLDVLSFATDMHDNREDVFKNLTGAKLDKAAVSFMVDNSSSTRNIIGDMYAILSGILQIMSRACIPTEAIGYTAEETESDQWRDIPAHLTIIKEFKESYSGKVLRRCAPPDFLGLTNDLDCMRFCVPRLWARPEKKKVLIVLCDGSPYFRSSVLTEKLQRSYKEYIDICRKAGIVIFGIGIGADLSEYFGDDFAMVDTTNVGEVLMTKLTKILNQGRG
jgi:cobalamin biosynthesis protein CobT